MCVRVDKGWGLCLGDAMSSALWISPDQSRTRVGLNLSPVGFAHGAQSSVRSRRASSLARITFPLRENSKKDVKMGVYLYFL
jgi:hypothetical protein